MLIAEYPRATWQDHVALARIDHWVKNLFVLPGAAVAVATGQVGYAQLGWTRMGVGLLAVCLASSSNYVLNELLDAPHDRQHPLRRDRPAAAGRIHVTLAWLQWLSLFAVSLVLGLWVSHEFTFTLVALWVMGLVYNVPPLRAKDVPFLDVPVEAVNNPIRLAAGWYMTGASALPMSSLLASYWMAGCYLMAIKRLAEFRDLRSAREQTAYRPCFRYYSEQSLLASAMFYGSLALLFLGAFMGRYRLELVVSYPFVAVVMALYLALAYKPDSAVQRPEALLSERWLMAAVAICVAVMVAMLFVNLPWLYDWFTPTASPAYQPWTGR